MLSIVTLLAGAAFGGPGADIVCPDGEPVRPIKAKACERPFKLWAKDVSVSIKARANSLDGEATAAVTARELSDRVSQVLRTQGSALCVGMMTAPCSVKDRYGDIVDSMPSVMLAMEQAGSIDDLVSALDRAEQLASRAPEVQETEETGPQNCLVDDELIVLNDSDQKRVQAVPGGTWSINVQANGGGVDGAGVVLSWQTMSCKGQDGAGLREAHTPPGRTHTLECDVPSSGESMWIVNPQGGLLDGAPGRVEVRLSVCPAE